MSMRASNPWANNLKYPIRILFLGLSLFLFQMSGAQDDLLSLLEEDEETYITSAAFKTTRVINGHSIENVAKGVLDIKISHRFGFINSGIKDLFGLDNATIRIGGDYGVTDRLMIGVGRSSFEKTYDGFLKYRILRQATGAKAVPVSLSYMGSMAIVTADFPNPDRENYTSSKMFFTHQVILARKFSDKFTLQLMPTLLHRNLVPTPEISNDVFNVGVALRQKLSNRVTLNLEYYYVLPDQLAEEFENSLSVGFDIETGGHVFQLHFTNSTSMIHKGFIGETTGKWGDGDIHFGFNVSRVFTVSKPEEFK